MLRKTIYGIFRSALTILLLSAFSMPAFAQVWPGSNSTPPFAGGFLFDVSQDLEHRPVYGRLQLIYDFTKNGGDEATMPVSQTADPAASPPGRGSRFCRGRQGSARAMSSRHLRSLGSTFC